MIKLSDILTVVCNVTKVPLDKTTGKSRKGNIMVAKKMFCYIATENYHFGQQATAVFVGYENHASALTNRDSVQGYLDSNDQKYIKIYNECILQLKEKASNNITEREVLLEQEYNRHKAAIAEVYKLNK